MDAARAAERSISAIWLDSGSPSVDLLMDWAIRAMADKDYPAALDFLDRVVTMKPDYVEGWNKRATVYFLVDDYGKSIADIERVLALEPRHFGALAGLGTILRDLDEEDRALAVYRRLLEIDPHMDDVRTVIDKLTAEGADGRRSRPVPVRPRAGRRRRRRRCAACWSRPARPSGTPAVMMMRSPGLAKPSRQAIAQARSNIRSRSSGSSPKTQCRPQTSDSRRAVATTGDMAMIGVCGRSRAARMAVVPEAV